MTKKKAGAAAPKKAAAPNIKDFKIPYKKHPHVDHIEISEPFICVDAVEGEKIARAYHYLQGMNAPHKVIPKGGYEIGSKDNITLTQPVSFRLIGSNAAPATAIAE